MLCLRCESVAAVPSVTCLGLCGIAEGSSFEVMSNEPRIKLRAMQEWPHFDESPSVFSPRPTQVVISGAVLALRNSEAEIFPGRCPCRRGGNCRILIDTFQRSTLSELKAAFADIWSFWDLIFLFIRMTLLSPNRFLFLTDLPPSEGCLPPSLARSHLSVFL